MTRSTSRAASALAGPLLNQQFWRWGQDIRRPEGNLLVAFGFQRTRPPETVQGSSCYRLTLDGAEIVLWGWGVLWNVGGGGLFISRQRFEPELTDRPLPETCWGPEGLPPRLPVDCDPRRAARQFAALAEWIADYECWALRAAGIDYCRACLTAPPRAKLSILPEQVPALWRCLGHDWAATILPPRSTVAQVR